MCFRSVPKVSQRCFRNVSKVSQEVFQRCFRGLRLEQQSPCALCRVRPSRSKLCRGQGRTQTTRSATVKQQQGSNNATYTRAQSNNGNCNNNNNNNNSAGRGRPEYTPASWHTAEEGILPHFVGGILTSQPGTAGISLTQLSRPIP